MSLPCIFLYQATHLLVKISHYHVPPCIGQYRGGDMIVKIFLVSCPPHVLANTGEGHEIDLFLLISGTLSFQALIKLITMWTLCVWLGHIGKYHLHSSKLGFNTDLEPAALGPYWTPISQNSDGISQYVLARRTVFYQYKATHMLVKLFY